MATRWKPNVTVAAVIEQDGRFLLVEEHTSEGLRLNTPAGHLDPGESPAEGCAREALEETAHLFTPTALIGIYMARFQGQRIDEDITYMRFAFAGTLGPQQPGRMLDTGIVRTLWMTPGEIRAGVARHRSPLLLQCVEDYLAGQRYPLDLIHVDESIAGSRGGRNTTSALPRSPPSAPPRTDS
jgi:8-oxo-dGTP pyrophosphatase MutT (NUDIX family)